ncbi:MAG: hypothetical protein KKC75_04745 [Nanoarchaeota archaeon]|nr:hypothetical protein [Nanoarchaeota archaeon]MBU1005840.1 hypothetical protein [Nanoarchaeota archaeon]MBU1946116.1 hypothetical protein [Nanoarchaeota archaeon]
MGESRFSFFVTDIIILLVFLGLIRIIFRFKGLGFLLELLFLVVMLFAAFIALIPAYSGSRGGWGFLAIIFFMILLDLLVIYLKTSVTGKAFMAVLLLSAIGFVIAILNIKKDKEEEIISTEEPEEEKDEKVYTNFEPGKYIASKQGTVYHSPKCEWANNIKEHNRIWLASDQEAKKKGYKKHDCLK